MTCHPFSTCRRPVAPPPVPGRAEHRELLALRQEGDAAPSAARTAATTPSSPDARTGSRREVSSRRGPVASHPISFRPRPEEPIIPWNLTNSAARRAADRLLVRTAGAARGWWVVLAVDTLAGALLTLAAPVLLAVAVDATVAATRGPSPRGGGPRRPGRSGRRRLGHRADRDAYGAARGDIVLRRRLVDQVLALGLAGERRFPPGDVVSRLNASVPHAAARRPQGARRRGGCARRRRRARRPRPPRLVDRRGDRPGHSVRLRHRACADARDRRVDGRLPGAPGRAGHPLRRRAARCAHDPGLRHGGPRDRPGQRAAGGAAGRRPRDVADARPFRRSRRARGAARRRRRAGRRRAGSRRRPPHARRADRCRRVRARRARPVRPPQRSRQPRRRPCLARCAWPRCSPCPPAPAGRRRLGPGRGALDAARRQRARRGRRLLARVDLDVARRHDGGRRRPLRCRQVDAGARRRRSVDPDDGTVQLDGVALGGLDRRDRAGAVAFAFDVPHLVGRTMADALGYGHAGDAGRPAPRPGPCPSDGVRRAPARRRRRRRCRRRRSPAANANASASPVRWCAGRGCSILDDATSSLDTVTEAGCRTRSPPPAASRRRSSSPTASPLRRVPTSSPGSTAACCAVGAHADLWHDPATEPCSPRRSRTSPTAGSAQTPVMCRWSTSLIGGAPRGRVRVVASPLADRRAVVRLALWSALGCAACARRPGAASSPGARPRLPRRRHRGGRRLAVADGRRRRRRRVAARRSDPAGRRAASSRSATGWCATSSPLSCTGRHRRPVASAEASAVARLVGQTDTARDISASLLAQAFDLAATVAMAVVGLALLAPLAAVVVLVPVVATVAVVATMVPSLARRTRRLLRADEALAATTATVAVARRDIAACGAEARALHDVGRCVDRRARSSRALARTGCAAQRGQHDRRQRRTDRPARCGAVADGPRRAERRRPARGDRLRLGQPPAGAARATDTLATSLVHLRVVLRNLAERDGAAGAAPSDRRRRRPPRSAGLARRRLDVRPRRRRTADRRRCRPDRRRRHATWPSSGRAASASRRSSTCSPACARPTAGGCRSAGGFDRLPAAGLRSLVTVVPAGGVRVRRFAARQPHLPRRVRRPTSELCAASPPPASTQLVDRLGGLDGPVDPGELSEGERQLVVATRVWLSPAAVVILDEATSRSIPRPRPGWRRRSVGGRAR